MALKTLSETCERARAPWCSFCKVLSASHSTEIKGQDKQPGVWRKVCGLQDPAQTLKSEARALMS